MKSPLLEVNILDAIGKHDYKPSHEYNMYHSHQAKKIGSETKVFCYVLTHNPFTFSRNQDHIIDITQLGGNDSI